MSVRNRPEACPCRLFFGLRPQRHRLSGYFPAENLTVSTYACARARGGFRHTHLHRLTLLAPGGRLGSPAPGEAASSPRSWDSGEPARPETPTGSQPLCPRVSSSRSFCPAGLPSWSVPFPHPWAGRVTPSVFPSRVRLVGKGAAFHLLIISVDTWARGIRRSSD